MLRIAVTFLVSIFVTFNLLIPNAWALGNFSRTCRNVSVSGSTLTASCERANGGYQNTSINLNRYIGNIDGSLSWDDQNFIETCRNTSLKRGSILGGECKKRNQNFVNTNIDLDAHIANIDGNLRYE